ncbi:hypothetical protein TRIUR3_08097 [Triticum urartu]|uniref:Uncharacterized protein n=1 Tax=Triticum urartu TaxID=4572 RepID=M7YR30_TRIUA|nr:hypothetical protein TRIUR3_08097 [Triticum urartu]
MTFLSGVVTQEVILLQSDVLSIEPGSRKGDQVTRSDCGYKTFLFTRFATHAGGVSVWLYKTEFVVSVRFRRCQCELVTTFGKCRSVGYILEDNTIRLVMPYGHIAVKDNAFAMGIDISGWCTVMSSAPGLQSCPKCKLYIDRVDACTLRLQPPLMWMVRHIHISFVLQ